MNRPCFQSHRRKTQHSSMFYCIHDSAITPIEKRNLGDLDKIFSSPNRFYAGLAPTSWQPRDLQHWTVLNMTLLPSIMEFLQLPRQLVFGFQP